MEKKIVFEEDSADGWRIAVKKHGVHVGNIIKNSNTGHFEYFSGTHNFSGHMFEHTHLDALKKKIEHSPVI